ncbi:hypothetical protein ACFVJW_26650 [Streptomyces libani]|uniref:hypothetical protein n=1 Tax=Streptomyces nigrescens TaxID=1920 RepID=UPI0036410087
MEYRIIRVYRVAAGSQAEATDRFMEALEMRVERDYHVRDIVKGESVGDSRPAVPVSWWVLVKRQLLGR